MAAATITDKSLLAANIAGYAGAYFAEQLALIRAGVVAIDSDPAFSALKSVGGNTYARRNDVASSADWEIPVAATSPTINALATATEIGVVARRVLFFGNEDVASLAVGEDINSVERKIGETLGHRSGVGIEKMLLQKVALAAFTQTTGALSATHGVYDQSAAFNFTDHVGAANLLMGENVNVFNTMLIHSTVYHKARARGAQIAEANISDMDMLMKNGLTFVGMFGNLRVFLCDRLYNANGVYDTLLCGPNAFRLDYQMRDSIEVFPRSVNAGGTTTIGMNAAVAPGIAKMSYTGTAPTGIAGAEDATLATVTNWTKVTGASVAEIPIVCIKTLAEVV